MEKVKYSDILAGIDESWSIKEKAKYIYNEICKISSYDERFIYSKNPELLRSIYNMKIDVEKVRVPLAHILYFHSEIPGNGESPMFQWNGNTFHIPGFQMQFGISSG